MIYDEIITVSVKMLAIFFLVIVYSINWCKNYTKRLKLFK